MLGLEEVTYTYATITCDWPSCTNRIDLHPGPADIDREKREIRGLRNLATRHGWSIDKNISETICPYHTQKGHPMKFTELSEKIAAEARQYEESPLLVIKKWHGSLRSIADCIIESGREGVDPEYAKWLLDDIQFSLRSMAVGAAIILESLGVADPAADFNAEYARAAAKHPGMTLDCDGPTNENRFYALAEEVGEVCAALTYDNKADTGHNSDLISEVTQVGGLAIAWLIRFDEEES
jgi:hypothetical protein|nr:MAG TPA: hypothetical protein [Caudoviricetes sp.]